MARTIHSKSTGQRRLPPDPERTARIEREKEQTRRREEHKREERKREQRESREHEAQPEQQES